MKNDLKSVYIIAEAGVNHNGSLDIALKMIEAASRAGADAVKFQTFVPELVVTRNAEKASYQIQNTGHGKQIEMLRKLSLTRDDFLKIRDKCADLEVDFLSTPFDVVSAAFLHEIGMKYFKIASGEILNIPLLKEIIKFNKGMILSTGMCSRQEVSLVSNMIPQHVNAIFLHCNTEYPTPLDDVNLYAMNDIKQLTGRHVGYSDHTIGVETCLAAVSIGAKVIEKHFTLDRNFQGPDQLTSLVEVELADLVERIRKTEIIISGDRIKNPSKSEFANRVAIRRSIVAAREIKKGDELSEFNLTCKRPAVGISSIEWDNVVGTKAVRDFNVDECIEL